jgi:hypothetical protein
MIRQHEGWSLALTASAEPGANAFPLLAYGSGNPAPRGAFDSVPPAATIWPTVDHPELRRLAQYFFIRVETSCLSSGPMDLRSRRFPLPDPCSSSIEAITAPTFPSRRLGLE